jgi:hypothetical protein
LIKEEERMRILAAIVLFFGFFVFCNVSEGALVVMKNGNKVDGKFLSATDDEIAIEVASQILKIKLSDVSYVSFDGRQPASGGGDGRLSTSTTQKSNQAPEGAKNAIQALRALQSVLGSGVNYKEYRTRLGDTKIKVDQFLGDKSANPELKKHMSSALGYYMAAALVWDSKINPDAEEETFTALSRNQYCMRCGQLQKYISDYKKEKGGNLDAYFEGRLISIAGPEYLWKCADESISAVDKTNK